MITVDNYLYSFYTLSLSNVFRDQGKKIIINDILTSNYISYLTWFGNEKIDYTKIKKLIHELNSIEGFFGYVSNNFGNRYFSVENSEKIDAIREKIESYRNINQREKV